MTWLLVGALIWVVLAVPIAMLIGRGIRLADARRVAATQDAAEANFVATDVPPVEAPEEPWIGPATVPFAPSRLPWGGDRTSARLRPPVIRHPVKPLERDPGARESGTRESGPT
jgi:hypothetical protein